MNVRIYLLLICLPMMLVACRRGEVSVERNPAGGVDVSVVLTEADVSGVIADALAAGGNPLLRDPQVDLQNGAIFVTGEHDRRDGGGRVSGSFRITVTVQDGVHLPQVTELNIEGIESSDARIARLNLELAAGFLRRANRADAISVQSVNITDSDFTIVFNVQRQ